MKSLLRAALARILIMRCLPPSPWIIVLSTLIWALATHCASALAQAPQVTHGQFSQIAAARPETRFLPRTFYAAYNTSLTNVLGRDNGKGKLASRKYCVYRDDTATPPVIGKAFSEADPLVLQDAPDSLDLANFWIGHLVDRDPVIELGVVEGLMRQSAQLGSSDAHQFLSKTWSDLRPVLEKKLNRLKT